jgi:Ca2+-binding EF-hand superfamily protein
MNTRPKLALWLAIGSLLSASVQAQTDNPDPTPGQAQPNRPNPPPPFGQALMDVLQKYDTNHDGQLDQNEMAALQQDIADGKVRPPGLRRRGGPGGAGGPPWLPKDILEKYDTNHVGYLDENERAALRKDIADGKIQLPQFGPGQRGPGQHGPGPGGMRPFPTAQQVLERFDADKDGKLDEAELTAFLNEIQSHLPPPPAGRPGPRFGAGGPNPPPGEAPPPPPAEEQQ